MLKFALFLCCVTVSLACNTSVKSSDFKKYNNFYCTTIDGKPHPLNKVPYEARKPCQTDKGLGEYKFKGVTKCEAESFQPNLTMANVHHMLSVESTCDDTCCKQWIDDGWKAMTEKQRNQIIDDWVRIANKKLNGKLI